MLARASCSLTAVIVVSSCAGAPARGGGAGADKPGGNIVRLEMAPGLCTEEVCPASNPCCDSCGAGEWFTAGTPRRAARAATGQLPICLVDGCGRCPFALAASGVVMGDDFVATRWTRVPADGCAAQRCDGEGACDAVLADRCWIWEGARCIPYHASGCRLVGPDCDRLYPDEQQCQRHHAACAGEAKR
jgi:hypothetical protein